jgi:serine/threonine protein kinase
MSLTETLAAEITRQLLSTLVFLHSNNLIYGSNLSSESLFLDVDSSIDENLNIKVRDIDIEIAKRIACFGN